MEENEIQAQLAERFKALPPVVQHAITSADVQAHLRTLAETHKLHVDQWSLLENEVMLTLLGIQRTDDLAKNIKAEVGVDDATATALAGDISRVVFEPVRAELEKELPEPEGSASAEGAIESREQPVPAPRAEAAKPVAAPVAAATPPKPAPDTKIARVPVSNSYGTTVPSHERTAIEGDPYREQLK